MLRSSPSAALTRARAESTLVIPMLLHEHPLRPEQGEGDEADDVCVVGVHGFPPGWWAM